MDIRRFLLLNFNIRIGSTKLPFVGNTLTCMQLLLPAFPTCTFRFARVQSWLPSLETVYKRIAS